MMVRPPDPVNYIHQLTNYTAYSTPTRQHVKLKNTDTSASPQVHHNLGPVFNPLLSASAALIHQDLSPVFNPLLSAACHHPVDSGRFIGGLPGAIPDLAARQGTSAQWGPAKRDQGTDFPGLQCWIFIKVPGRALVRKGSRHARPQHGLSGLSAVVCLGKVSVSG